MPIKHAQLPAPVRRKLRIIASEIKKVTVSRGGYKQLAGSGLPEKTIASLARGDRNWQTSTLLWFGEVAKIRVWPFVRTAEETVSPELGTTPAVQKIADALRELTPDEQEIVANVVTSMKVDFVRIRSARRSP